MGTVYVAASKAQQEWGADVGLGKHLYKLGWSEDGITAEALAGFAGQSDWKIITEADSEGPEEALIEKAAIKEKEIDPNYYPRLRGARGVFKMSIDKVENALLVAMALENRTPSKSFKVKPQDIAAALIRAAQ